MVLGKSRWSSNGRMAPRLGANEGSNPSRRMCMAGYVKRQTTSLIRRHDAVSSAAPATGVYFLGGSLSTTHS